jgi:hypothetical protein
VLLSYFPVRLLQPSSWEGMHTPKRDVGVAFEHEDLTTAPYDEAATQLRR